MTSVYAAENLQPGFVPMVYGYYDRANMMESTPEIINHSHPLCEIMYVNEGAMSIETEEGVHRVGTGQFIWIDAGVRHWDLRFNNGLCSMMNIEYQYEAGEALAPELGRLVREDRALGALFEQQPRVLTLTDRNQVIFQLMKSILPMAYSTNEPSRHLCSLLCTHITDALDILNSSYAEPLTASDVAERLHIHPSYLHRLFREYTSRTMKEHLQRIRIRRAQELLTGTRKSIQEIADEVGFGSTQQFQQLFRRIVGVRPMDYRKQHQEKE